MCSVHLNASLGEVPKEVLDLVFAVLVLQQIDELVKPLFGEFDKQTPGVAELWVVWVQDIGARIVRRLMMACSLDGMKPIVSALHIWYEWSFWCTSRWSVVSSRYYSSPLATVILWLNA